MSGEGGEVAEEVRKHDAGRPPLLSLTAIVPTSSGECRTYAVEASPEDSGERLKELIEKQCHVPTFDQELFVASTSGSSQHFASPKVTLAEAGITDGATITVAVHGLSSGPLPDDGDAPDAVQASISRGSASYYHAHAHNAEGLTEEQRIVSGGPPQRLRDDSALPAVPAGLQRPPALDEEDDEDTGRPARPILNYAWSDEAQTIKIYISADSEPEALKAAGNGRDGRVEVRYKPQAVRVVVGGERHDYVLKLAPLYYKVVVEECKWRVSPNKRITLTLKKEEAMTWLKLLKPQQRTPNADD